MWRIELEVHREKQNKWLPAHQDFADEERAKETYYQFLDNEFLINVQKPYKFTTQFNSKGDSDE